MGWGSKKQSSKKVLSKLIHGLGAVLILCLLFFSYKYFIKVPINLNKNTSSQSVIDNYSNEVFKSSIEFNIPYKYLMALIQLECSGLKPAGERFEPHVYRQLKKVQVGSLKNYENVTMSHLYDASDEAIRNLATSWGPFQLMGYKCILLDVKIRDIRGPHGVYTAPNGSTSHMAIGSENPSTRTVSTFTILENFTQEQAYLQHMIRNMYREALLD